MKRFAFLCFCLLFWHQAFPCTNIIISKGASLDASCMLLYTNDGEWLYRLDKSPARSYPAGDSIEFVSGRNKKKGKIAQVRNTYAVLGFQMNEHQLCIGETTFTGREELWNRDKYLEYWHLMRLALERAKTAREAILVMTRIAEEYGYGSEGESFSIIDPDEAWILEMIGTGNGGEGAVWVAMKIPDGCISAHANMARIGEFPLNDPENCLYSANVISFAIEKGYYDPDSGEPFRFNHAYNPPSPDRLRYCESRVWSIFRRAAPGLILSPDYHRGIKGAERYPLWIKPDQKISLSMMMALGRDHYEGTEYDMTQGLDAGPFGNPNRNRPLYWEKNGDRYAWERPISTYNTAFSFVAQCRSFLPDALGGVVWWGVDDTYFTCYFPVFNSVQSISPPFATGDIKKFSWESAWWVFNLVSNYAGLRYRDMVKDIQKVQAELESTFIAEQDSVIAHAKTLNKKEINDFLTSYSSDCGVRVHQRWIALAEALFTKYNDGYIKNENGSPQEAAYPEAWTDEMIRIYPEKFKIPEWKSKNYQDELSY
jgi:dipeptidase